jgi:hypothetical protein
MRVAELGLDRVDDLHAEVHRVPDDLLLVVVVGERDRGVAVPERDAARILDLLERAGQLLCERRLRQRERERGGGGEGECAHCVLLL